jgi:hypothetical protein
MTETKPAKKTGKTYQGFTVEERAAMKERGKELKRAGKDGESDVLAKIAEMSGSDRAMAERLHALIKEHAPDLSPRTWYGMPAYSKDGKVLCFFTPAQKFTSRYAQFGFDETANLDDGAMWPVAFALQEWTPAVEERIVALVRKAAS